MNSKYRECLIIWNFQLGNKISIVKLPSWHPHHCDMCERSSGQRVQCVWSFNENRTFFDRNFRIQEVFNEFKANIGSCLFEFSFKLCRRLENIQLDIKIFVMKLLSWHPDHCDMCERSSGQRVQCVKLEWKSNVFARVFY